MEEHSERTAPGLGEETSGREEQLPNELANEMLSISTDQSAEEDISFDPDQFD